MDSIFRRALGADFDRLHPRLQHRFSQHSASGTAQLGSGVMTSLYRGPLVSLPVRALGSARRLELPPTGENVPFTLANYSYLDGFGRETFAYSRRFQLDGRVRRFDDTMVFSEQHQRIVNYLGSHQDIAAQLLLSVTETGGLRMVEGDQRIHAGRVGLRLPRALASRAEVIETWQEQEQRFTISVDISSAAGRLFAYQGWFTVQDRPMPSAEIPRDALPDRERRAE